MILIPINIIITLFHQNVKVPPFPYKTLNKIYINKIKNKKKHNEQTLLKFLRRTR